MFEKLTEHIYAYPCDGYTDRPNIGLVIGSRYSLLYDAGNSAAHIELMKKDLVEQGLPLPNYIALSHWHWDHSFGATFWNVPVIAGRETNEQLKIVKRWKWDDQSMADRVTSGDDIVFCNEMIKREFPDRSKIKVSTADIVFDGRMTIDLGGGVICDLIHSKGPHASDSVICHVPSDGFLFLGDSNCKDLYGLPWHFDIEYEEDFKKNTDALPYDSAKVKEFLRLLGNLDFTMCISGHSKAKTKEALFTAMLEEC